MTYQQAKNLRNDLLYMIGETYSGLKVTDVAIAPIDGDDFDTWMQRYIRTNNHNVSISPFTNDDLEVIFVYSYKGKSVDDTNILPFGNVIFECPKMGITIDLAKYGI